MKNTFFALAFVASAIAFTAFAFKNTAKAQQESPENSYLVDEFKRVIPDIQSGRKSLSVFQGEKAIQSDVRNIRFGADYFVVADSVWNGKKISIRRMFIKTSEIIWLIEDESAVVLKLRN
jgi:hypothetical protein